MQTNKPYHRKDRVSELIRKELGMLMLKEVNFKGAIATITRVVVSAKLDVARIYISVLPSPRAEDILANLKLRESYLQRELLRIISIKPMPKLMFQIDHGLEKAAAIEKALLDSAQS